MNTIGSPQFTEYLKNLAAPAGALIYLLTYAVQIHDYANKVGWRVFFLVVFVLAVSWGVYTWTAKELTIIEPRSLKPKYGTWIRYGAVAAALFSLGPLAYSFLKEPDVLTMPVHLANHTGIKLSICRIGEFYLSVPESPMSETQVASGRMSIIAEERDDSDNISVLPGTTKKVLAEFINPAKLLPMLKTGDHSARFLFYQNDGQILTEGGVIFTRKNIENRYLLLELKQPKNVK